MSADEREQLFQSFWQLQDYRKQNLYLRDLVRATATARGRPKDNSRKPKSKSVQYFLQPENKPAVQVCKTFFLDTFVITQRRIYRCLSKKDVSEFMDLRGKRPPSNKIDESCVKSVKEHIRSVLNDNRSCEKKKNQDLTVVAMYKLYEAWCAENATRPVKMHFYYKVFNENFKFHSTEWITCIDQDKIWVSELERKDLIRSRRNVNSSLVKLCCLPFRDVEAFEWIIINWARKNYEQMLESPEKLKGT